LIWGGKPAQLDTTQYHSGKLSYSLDKNVEYGPAFEKLAGDINEGGFNRIKISVFVYAKDSLTDAPLVVTIEDKDGNAYVWAASRIEDFVEPNRWGQAFFTFDVPGLQSPRDKIKVYVWNAEKKRFNIDEFLVEFYLDKRE
jgi:hypothetical protein